MVNIKLAIVIPAFNEEKNISRVINEALKYGEVIVVNDGSTDRTSLISKKLGAIVVNNNKKGYDTALESGFLEAKKRGFNAIITIDGDGQHNPTDLKKFKDRLVNGSDLVLGIRPKKKIKRISEILFSYIYSNLYGIHDPLCGMKGYNLKAYNHLGYFDSYNSIGFELTLFCKKKKYKISEIEIDILERNGNSKFGNCVISNLKILKSLIKSIKKYGFK